MVGGGVTDIQESHRFNRGRQLALFIVLICAAAATCAGCVGFVETDLTPPPTTTPSGAVRNPPAARSVNNSLGMTLVLIKPGAFTMGSPLPERRREMDEVEHPVQITNHFYLAETEVTRAQFEAFTRDTGYQTEPERSGDVITWRTPYIEQR